MRARDTMGNTTAVVRRILDISKDMSLHARNLKDEAKLFVDSLARDQI